jgi:hypothetical protein
LKVIQGRQTWGKTPRVADAFEIRL